MVGFGVRSPAPIADALLAHILADLLNEHVDLVGVSAAAVGVVVVPVHLMLLVEKLLVVLEVQLQPEGAFVGDAARDQAEEGGVVGVFEGLVALFVGAKEIGLRVQDVRGADLDVDFVDGLNELAFLKERKNFESKIHQHTFLSLFIRLIKINKFEPISESIFHFFRIKPQQNMSRSKKRYKNKSEKKIFFIWPKTFVIPGGVREKIL